MCQGLNSHYLHIIGDKLINPIPQGFIGPHYKDSLFLRWDEFIIPNIATFDHGTDQQNSRHAFVDSQESIFCRQTLGLAANSSGKDGARRR